MKLICIDSGNWTNLTTNKIYECDDFIYDSCYLIINDRNQILAYPKKYFITIEEYRNRRLEEIGI